MSPQDIGDQALLGQAGAGDTLWEESFTFADAGTWTIQATGGTGGGTGSIGISGGKAIWDGVSQDFAGYLAKQFSGGNKLSDEMFTQLGYGAKATKVDTQTTPIFFCASDGNFDMVDGAGNTIQAMGSLMFGAGGTNLGLHAFSRVNASPWTTYSPSWLGSDGADYWTTFYRTSSTGARIIVYPTSAKSSSDIDDTFTVSEDITDLDRALCCSQNGGAVTYRKTDAELLQMDFKSGVNEE